MRRSGRLRRARLRLVPQLGWHPAIPVILLGVIGAAVGFALGTQRSVTYDAEARILLAPLDGNAFSPGGRGDDLLNLQTEAQLVSADAVVQRVVDDLELDSTASELTSRIAVSNPPSTQILNIVYTAQQKERATEIAQALAETFLAYRSERAQAVVDTRTQRIDEQIDLQQAELDRLIREAGRAPNEVTRQQVQERVDVATNQLSQLEAQRAAYLSTPTDPGLVVTPAGASPSLPLPPSVVLAVVGLLGGVVLGTGYVLFRSRALHRVVQPHDVASIGTQLLGTLTLDQVRRVQEAVHANAAVEPVISRDFKTLRAALLNRERRRPVTILISTASTEMKEPRSPLGLAYALGMSNLDVVLVDTLGADYLPYPDDDPTAQAGLTDVLTGAAPLDRALTRVGTHLRMISPGNAVHRFEDLVGAPLMGKLLEGIAATTDVVLVIGGSLHDPASRTLAGLADAVIIETAQGQARVSDLLPLVEDELLPLLGVIYVRLGRQRGRRLRRSL